MTGIAYRTPGPADGAPLAAMAATSFAATFADKIAPAYMRTYLDRAYGPTGDMARDLADPAIDWRIAVEGDEPIGYIKLSAMTLPFTAAPGALEVRQLYVRADRHGAGVAATLMEWAIERARTRGAPELFLAVFDDNVRATRFYARRGFAKVGRFDFHTGNMVHDDGIWRLAL